VSVPGFGSPGPARATVPEELLAALVDSDPGRPRVTWYDDTDGPTRGERIELSGRVLANWVAKGANLLVDDLDVEPGDVVTLDLPAHWRLLCWAGAAWAAGAVVRLAGPGGALRPAGVLVTDRPDVRPAGVRPPDVREQVAVCLPALARGWAGPELPSGTVDGAADLHTQPDHFEPFEPASPASPALEVGGPGEAPHGRAELLADARRLASQEGWRPGARVLVTTSSRDASPVDALLAVLAAWSGDGSVVLVRDGDPAEAQRRRRDERVTDVWPR
jgi:uncharacterized protein (TIGR03089 family)